MELTYVALKRIKVGGKFREPGDPVPEAERWTNRPAYISNGSIAPVPKGAAVPLEDEEEPSLADLTIGEMKQRVNSGALSIEDAWVIEQEGQQRTTLLNWLEKRQEDREKDKDPDPEG